MRTYILEKLLGGCVLARLFAIGFLVELSWWLHHERTAWDFPYSRESLNVNLISHQCLLHWQGTTHNVNVGSANTLLAYIMRK